MKIFLIVSLMAISAIYLWLWIRATGSAAPEGATRGPARTLSMLGLGFGTNFLDTLGIGSFATTTSVFRLFSLVADERIPGTLNVGHALPTIVEAILYITFIAVSAGTLLSMIGAAVAGAWLGAGIVSRWSRRRVQIGMGLALFAAAGLMLMAQLDLIPGGGEALTLSGLRFAAAIAGNFSLGALMTLGIGLYAPCMILVSLLGMDPRAAFPIMMGSCAFLMPVGSMRFIRSGRYDLPAARGLALGGLPGVLIAALVVKSLPLSTVRVLVVVVVLYTAFMLLRSAACERRAALDTALAIQP